MTTTTASPSTLYLGCPDWCRDRVEGASATDSLFDDVHPARDLTMDAKGQVQSAHSGPKWGAFSAGGWVNLITGEVVCSVYFDSYVFEQAGVDDSRNPEVLRQVAADALAAAEWLEAQA